jgi:uncharacterized membrane protein (DUF2068 family)
MTTSRGSAAALWIIGSFKLAKGLLLVVLGLMAQRLLHHGDVAETLRAWASDLHLRPESRLISILLAKISGIDPRTLRHASVGIFTYAALLSIEGVGLLCRQRWAEYATIIVTGSFIPVEIYELMKRVTVTRMGMVVINAAIVGYLVVRLHRERSEERRTVMHRTRT